MKITWKTINGESWCCDENGNRNSVEFYEGKKEAEEALRSLESCTNCINCSDCSGCSDCSTCGRCSGCSGCSACFGCSGCSGCSDCFECRDCIGCINYIRCHDRKEIAPSASTAPAAKNLNKIKTKEKMKKGQTLKVLMKDKREKQLEIADLRKRLRQTNNHKKICQLRCDIYKINQEIDKKLG